MKSPGQVAYEAYCGVTGWKSAVSGADLPQWENVKDGIKIAWEVAADAVLKLHLKDRTVDEAARQSFEDHVEGGRK